jgi:hypothetical protein
MFPIFLGVVCSCDSTYVIRLNVLCTVSKSFLFLLSFCLLNLSITERSEIKDLLLWWIYSFLIIPSILFYIFLRLYYQMHANLPSLPDKLKLWSLLTDPFYFILPNINIAMWILSPKNAISHLFFFFFLILGIEVRVLCVLASTLTTELHPQPLNADFLNILFLLNLLSRNYL